MKLNLTIIPASHAAGVVAACEFAVGFGFADAIGRNWFWSAVQPTESANPDEPLVVLSVRIDNPTEANLSYRKIRFIRGRPRYVYVADKVMENNPMATPNQIRFLSNLGMDPRDARKLSTRDASREITRRKDLRDGPPGCRFCGGHHVDTCETQRQAMELHAAGKPWGHLCRG